MSTLCLVLWNCRTRHAKQRSFRTSAHVRKIVFCFRRNSFVIGLADGVIFEIEKADFFENYEEMPGGSRHEVAIGGAARLKALRTGINGGFLLYVQCTAIDACTSYNGSVQNL